METGDTKKNRFQLQAKIVDITCADGICKIVIEAPEICEASSAGQFVMVKTSEGNSNDPLFRRPFSIHRISDGLLTIVFKVVGRGTKNLANMRKSQLLDVVGPLGKGFILTDHARYYLVGGGMGIAPMYYLAENLRREKTKSQIFVMMGGQTLKEIEVFQDITELPGVTLRMATNDGSFGHHGLVTDLMEQTAVEHGDGAVYCCGPLPMMKAVALFCKDKNFDCQVSLETTMACGVGACLGCVVKGSGTIGEGYLHVCKDGPVFAAGQIWT
ncbi:MAG: dihydroorotate dehydrogenase electron transfer subunit [Deltaproteobacteria bacterium]|nr:dihydroorotate dehydrogenase electron transfer subunit [Deltaproteobacteria bacterium]